MRRAGRVIRVGGESIRPGETKRLDIPVARLPIHTMLHLPVTVVNGKRRGPTLWLSATLHGDELNGMEITRRVLTRVAADRLSGTLIAVPIVNVFGFINGSRYLPDRRDLNRSFPGSKRGSLASRLAHLFMTEIVALATHGIDLHTASPPRINLPQVRANLSDAETLRCAHAFRAPVMVDSQAPKGALRWACARRGIPILLYEAGEPNRLNPDAVETGVDGVLRVMAELEMLERADTGTAPVSTVAKRTTWVRAAQSGVLYLDVDLGDEVKKRQRLGVISDPLGDSSLPIRAPSAGLVIGRTTSALVHQGDAILNLAMVNAGGKSEA